MEEETSGAETVEEKPEFEKKLEEMRAENERMEKNITELKDLKAFDALSGKTDAAPPDEKPKEETPEEYSRRAERGEFNK